jgi:hypothetical protein
MPAVPNDVQHDSGVAGAMREFAARDVGRHG